MYKRFILLGAILLGSNLPISGQSSRPQVVKEQGHGSQIMATHQTVSSPLLSSRLLLSQDPVSPPVNFTGGFARPYQADNGVELLLPMDEVKTLTLTQSTLPLVQLWGRRFQLNAFQSTLHSQNVQLGPLGYNAVEGFCPTQQSPSRSRSIHLVGISLNFHFGRDARATLPIHAWRDLTQFVGSVLN